MSNLPYSPAEFHKKGVTIARHYGFLPAHEAIEVMRARKAKEEFPTRTKESRSIPAVPQKIKRLDGVGGELTSLAKWCVEQSLLPCTEPILLFHTVPHATTQANRQIGRTSGNGKQSISFGLHVFGTKQSIAEALVLKTAMTILSECGVKGARVHVNSIGDRDSSAKHLREASIFLRKNAHLLPSQAVEALKEDPAYAMEFLYRRSHPVLSDMPRPMEFLSTQSRRHLKEVLEFIETAELSYELDDLLLHSRDCYSQSVYEIRLPQNSPDSSQNGEPDGGPTHTVLARGGRYDELARRLFKVQCPAVGIMFTVESPQKEHMEESPTKRARKPQVCFVHVGFEAKLRSLHVIETFRRARIPFQQMLNSERLTEQLALAESVAAPYTVIMGHKEALEGTVILRNTSTRSQQTVAVDLLPDYLRRSA